MSVRSKWLTKGLVVNLSGKHQTLAVEDHDLFRQAHTLRIDPSDSCNASCVFCESAFNSRGARLPLPVFEEALASAGQSPHFKTLQIDCTYEPTIRRDLVEFGRILERTKFVNFPDAISLVSNCWLLHRHDMDPFVNGGLNKLHVSLHSHDTEEFKDVMGHDYREQVATNLKNFKARYPQVPISTVCVINTLNMKDPLAFVRWVFHDIGVDYLRFTRADIVGVTPDSPAKEALDRGGVQSFELTDDEWRAFADKLDHVESLGLELIHSKQALKFGARSVDALRLKRKEAPREAHAIRHARKVHLEGRETVLQA